MSLYCKNCGTELNVQSGQKIAVCDFCEMEQTVPTLDNPEKIWLFIKANKCRMDCRFDLAKVQYENIIAQYPDDNEAYWCKLLCEYGIEYVDDDLTEKKLPTCHRTVTESIFDNSDYKLIMSRATEEEKAIYETEAKEIDRIQKEILSSAQQQEPFDVFICYKESDENNRRTKDSQIANKIYANLTSKGYKVFYSRVTLKELAGSKYEPIIYSALTTAKVMLVVTTSKDYVNAPWVRNEWSRYLEFMQSDYSKSIVPCISVMDAYDLPGELVDFQALNTADMDFTETLTRQIDSKFGKNSAQSPEAVTVTPTRSEENPTQTGNNANIQTLLKRVDIFLMDEEWSDANEYAEKVLDIDPECCEAYLGKLLAELKIRNKDSLKDSKESFDSQKTYQKVLRYASSEMKQFLNDTINFIKERNENERIARIYQDATTTMNNAVSEIAFKTAAGKFDLIPDYKDSKILSQKCYENAEEIRKNLIYEDAEKLVLADTIDSYNEAIVVYKSVIDWKDSREKIEYCEKRIIEINEKIEADRKNAIYEQAKDKARAGSVSDYENAIQIYKSIIDWKDSREQIEYCEQQIAEIRDKNEEQNQILEKSNNLVVLLEINRISDKIDDWDYFKKLVDNQNSLLSLLRKYPDLLQIVSIEEEIKKLNETIITLVVEKSQLGAIKKKRKKEIEEELDCIQSKKKDLKSKELQLIIAELKSNPTGSSLYAEYEKERKIQESVRLFNIDEDTAKSGILEVGSTITFGRYYQSNKGKREKEGIEWEVLASSKGRALLLSKYVLDCKSYNILLKNVTWETCSIRKWLNDKFIDIAFTDEEKAHIPTVTVNSSKNPNEENQENITQDKIFLLSKAEFEKIMYKVVQRGSKPTAYTKMNMVFWFEPESEFTDDWSWWLRSVGDKDVVAPIVNKYGHIEKDGDFVSITKHGVRPALWIEF